MTKAWDTGFFKKLDDFQLSLKVKSDFDKVIIYFDGSWAAKVSAGTQSYNASGLTASTSYEIATRTIDISGNINTTWVNDTATTAP